MLSRMVIVFFAALAACGGEDSPGEAPSRGVLATDAGAADGSTADASGDATASGDAAIDAGPIEEFEGEATYYDADGTGACGFPASSDFMVAAINDEQYSKENCGRCASVTGPRGTVVVRIVDKCPGCSFGDIDLSQTAFGKIARLADGRVDVRWHFVPCP